MTITTITRSAYVPFSAEQMFNLVNDIEQYPQFLPWCPDARILSKEEYEMRATIYFAKGIFHKSFTTLNHLSSPDKIEMQLLEGPFRHLEGTWEFQEQAAGGCQVSLNISFEFENKLVNMALGAFFNQIASSLVDAFSLRANDIYAIS